LVTTPFSYLIGVVALLLLLPRSRLHRLLLLGLLGGIHQTQAKF
jgi:hypothetical protein